MQSPQQVAHRRLKQLIDAIRESENAEREQKDGKQPATQQPGSGGSDADGIPDVVQLKLLRMLQSELNERTAAFAKAHPDAEKWTLADRAELAGASEIASGVVQFAREFVTKKRNPRSRRNDALCR